MEVELSIDGLPLPQGMQAGRTERPLAASSTVGSTEAMPGDPTAHGTVARAHAELGRMIVTNERLSSLAVATRTEDSSLENIHDLVGRMQNDLGTIQKFYPPYPPGSEERVRLLKSYSGLRNLIDRLTVPPETGDLAVTEQAKQNARQVPDSQYTILLTNHGAIQTVRRDDVQIGPTGLNIPELQETAGDNEVAEASKQLDSAAKAISNERARNAEAALAGADAEIQRGKAAALDVPAEQVGTREATAQQWALDVRTGLAGSTTGILHTTELRDFMTGL